MTTGLFLKWSYKIIFEFPAVFTMGHKASQLTITIRMMEKSIPLPTNAMEWSFVV